MTINLHGKVTSKIYYYLNLRNIYYQGVYEGKRIFNPNSYGVEMNYEGENIWHVLGSDELKDYQYHLDIMESRNIDDEVTLRGMFEYEEAVR